MSQVFEEVAYWMWYILSGATVVIVILSICVCLFLAIWSIVCAIGDSYNDNESRRRLRRLKRIRRNRKKRRNRRKQHEVRE